MRHVVRYVFILGLLSFLPLAYAAVQPPALVLDMRNAPHLPRNFRATSLPTKRSAINEMGFKNLHIAGGAQFSELALQKILATLNTKTLTIIDLRQESHGFLNGNAVSWYGYQDAANAGKSDEEIETLQNQLLTELGQQESAEVYRVAQKSPQGEIKKTTQVEFAVHHVSTEAELAEKYKLNYHRLYVQDFHAPSPEQVDRFLEIIKQIPSNEYIYFHCHAGVGRTTTFMVMYDMLKNAKRVSFNDILNRQNAIGGKDLTVMPRTTSFKYKYADARLSFLRQFYQFAKTYDGKTTWSAYLRENPNK